MKDFTRTIITTTVHCSAVSFKDGSMVSEPMDDIVLDGKVSENDALKKVRKANTNGVVTGLEYNEQLYAISYNDFMKYAHKVEPKAKADSKEDAGKQA